MFNCHACGCLCLTTFYSMREKVRLSNGVTLHAEEEMEDDDISILDVEHVLLTGETIER